MTKNNSTCDSCALPIYSASPDGDRVRYCFACATRENCPTFCTAYPDADAREIRAALLLTDSRTDSGLPLELCLKMGRDSNFCARVIEIMRRPDLAAAIRHECRALACMS